MIAPVILAALFLLVPPPFQDEKPFLTEEGLLEIVREAIPAVERATGATFREPVWTRISTRADVERALGEELVPQMKILSPGATEPQAREMARRFASVYGQILVAKFAWKSGLVHVVPETLRRLAKLVDQPKLLDRDVLRVIVTHELVHAIDHQEHALFRNFGAAKSPNELEILNAISEGHAQHVTRRVFEAAGRLEPFETYEKALLAGPPGLGEAEEYLASIIVASLKLAYVDGRTFFDALEKTGRKTYVQDVFRRPPAGKNVILKPERYYSPKASDSFDPRPAFEAFARDFGPDWTRRSQELDSGTLRAAFGNFVDAKEADAAVKGVEEAHVFVLNPKRDPQGKMVIAAVVRAADAAAAKKLADLSVEVSKAKDKKFTEGVIKILKADYGAMAGTGHTLIRKTMSVQDQEISMTLVTGTEGAFEFEVVFSNEEVDDARLKAMVGRLLEKLPKP